MKFFNFYSKWYDTSLCSERKHWTSKTDISSILKCQFKMFAEKLASKHAYRSFLIFVNIWLLLIWVSTAICFEYIRFLTLHVHTVYCTPSVIWANIDSTWIASDNNYYNLYDIVVIICCALWKTKINQFDYLWKRTENIITLLL